MRRWRWAIVLMLAGCRDPVEPVDVELGLYPLASVNRVPLPAAFGEPDGCEVVFGGGELLLLTARDYSLEVRFGYACPDGSAGHDAIAYSGRYSRGSDFLRVVLDPPPAPESEIAMIPEGDLLRVVISGESPIGIWAYPTFYMGPRQPLPETGTP
jgi:hypothetical protein